MKLALLSDVQRSVVIQTEVAPDSLALTSSCTFLNSLGMRTLLRVLLQGR